MWGDASDQDRLPALPDLTTSSSAAFGSRTSTRDKLWEALISGFLRTNSEGDGSSSSNSESGEFASLTPFSFTFEESGVRHRGGWRALHDARTDSKMSAAHVRRRLQDSVQDPRLPELRVPKHEWRLRPPSRPRSMAPSAPPRPELLLAAMPSSIGLDHGNSLAPTTGSRERIVQAHRGWLLTASATHLRRRLRPRSRRVGSAISRQPVEVNWRSDGRPPAPSSTVAAQPLLHARRD